MTRAPGTRPRWPSSAAAGPARARRAFAVAVTLALAVATAGCGGGSERPRDGFTYAALGDSTSAGAGIAPVADAGCQRSKVDFGSLVAERMDYSSFTDVSCIGAMTTNLLRPQLKTAVNGPQLDAVGTRTRLVTLTIGLNDNQFAYGLLSVCQSTTGEPSAFCGQLLAAPESSIDKAVAQGAKLVEDALLLIRKAAPKARIVLVGYPRYFPDNGSCPDRIPMIEQMVPKVRSALEKVNQAWKQVAGSVGADYIDTWAMSKGHDVCSDDPWVNGATNDPGKAAALHPFAAFHRAVANAIVKLLKQS